jgi:AAA domain
MRQLVTFAAGNNCRVILSGDTRQHHSVERGDALRILEKSASIASAALNKIFRRCHEPRQPGQNRRAGDS